MIKQLYFNWSEKRPPYDIWVWANYSLNEKWSLVKTCKRGCCVYSLSGTMVLPRFWYLATPGEGIKEQEVWDNTSQIDFNF